MNAQASTVDGAQQLHRNGQINLLPDHFVQPQILTVQIRNFQLIAGQFHFILRETGRIGSKIC